jgi:hypothetical protein
VKDKETERQRGRHRETEGQAQRDRHRETGTKRHAPAKISSTWPRSTSPVSRRSYSVMLRRKSLVSRLRELHKKWSWNRKETLTIAIQIAPVRWRLPRSQAQCSASALSRTSRAPPARRPS